MTADAALDFVEQQLGARAIAGRARRSEEMPRLPCGRRLNPWTGSRSTAATVSSTAASSAAMSLNGTLRDSGTPARLAPLHNGRHRCRRALRRCARANRPASSPPWSVPSCVAPGRVDSRWLPRPELQKNTLPNGSGASERVSRRTARGRRAAPRSNRRSICGLIGDRRNHIGMRMARTGDGMAAIGVEPFLAMLVHQPGAVSGDRAQRKGRIDRQERGRRVNHVESVSMGTVPVERSPARSSRPRARFIACTA